MASILIIDDESSVRTFLKQTLEKVGHHVREAPDGGTGLDLFRQSPADLVITDIFMPGTDGFAVLDCVRRESPGSKVITVTAGLGDDCAIAKERGAARTLVKPLSVRELLETVEEVL
jgi:DNA-binding response OmpR family regulator